MLAVDIMRLSTRMFRTNRSRTILTILGIGVGIGAILFLVSLGYGLQNLILDQITTSDALLSLDITVNEELEVKLDKNSTEGIKQIPGVDKVSPLVSTRVQMKIGDISTELLANFVNADYFRLDGTMLSQGKFYTDEDDSDNKVIISSSALKLFNITEEEIFDKKIKFSLIMPKTGGDNEVVRDLVNLENEFEVIGIIDEEYSNYVYMPFSISDSLGVDNYSKIKVKIIDEENLESVRLAVSEQGYLVSALSDIIEQTKQIFKVVQIVLASFGIVALSVSAIGMFNTMTIALLERTQEIGIMKALGATSADIWQMFLAEAVMIGFLGGASGLMVGMLGGEIFNYGLNLMAGALGGEKIDLFYTPVWFSVTIITFATIVGLATGFYPAKRAAKINCLEALRYK